MSVFLFYFLVLFFHNFLHLGAEKIVAAVSHFFSQTKKNKQIKSNLRRKKKEKYQGDFAPPCVPFQS
jgi:hypothetical protein